MCMHAFIICIYHLISPDCFTLKEIHPSPRFHPKESIGLLVHLQLICQIGMGGPSHQGPFHSILLPQGFLQEFVAGKPQSKKTQNRGSGECACYTPLCTFSVLTYALTGKKKTNDKTQLSASFTWGVQN